MKTMSQLEFDHKKKTKKNKNKNMPEAALMKNNIAVNTHKKPHYCSQL